MKKIVCIIICVFFVCLLILFFIPKSLFLPKYTYYFTNLNNYSFLSADKCCEMATDETEEIQIWFIRSYNSPKYNPHIDIITKNKYRELNILKMDIRFDEKSFTVLKDAVYILPEVVTTIDSNEIGWIANNNYYWLNGLLAKRIGKYSDQWPMLEFHKFFKNKKEGDSFIFNIFLEYYFDDNEIKTETLNYQVHVSTK